MDIELKQEKYKPWRGNTKTTSDTTADKLHEMSTKKKSVAKKMKKSWATEWHGKHAGGGDKFSSGFGGRDNS
jgi:hypothetical protein